MPMDLVAKIKFLDNATAPLRKVERQVERVKKATDMYTDANGRLRNAQGKFVSTSKSAVGQLSAIERMAKRAGSAMGRASSGTGGLVRSLGGVAAAYLSAKSAVGLFNKTIGAAAQYEVKDVTVRAMFGKQYADNATKYLDYIEKRAAQTQFTMEDYLSAGKSFIPTTKDNAQLAKAIGLAERLGALDEQQGIVGAAFALREMFSGDGLSLVERFELPRKAINEIKNLPLDKQLKALDKYLNQIGATNELIEAQASTGMGEWRKATAKMTKALREMGTEGLGRLKPILRDFNKYLDGADFKRFKEAGVTAFAGIFDDATKMVRNTTDYINKHYLKNPDFKKLETLESKVKFVLSDLTPVLSDGLRFGGELATKMLSGMVPAMTKGILDNPVLATTLGVAALIKNPTPIGLTVALSVTAPAWFKRLVEGVSPVVQGREKYLSQWENANNLYQKAQEHSAAGNKGPLYTGWTISAPEPKSWGEKAWEGFSDKMTQFRDWVKHPTPINIPSASETARRQLHGHAAGLDRVPYNGYPARLHRDEMVLTRTEAQGYRENQRDGGRGSRGDGPLIHIEHMEVRREDDIDKIADKLARAVARYAY
ncbi:hypothetical protein GNP92_15010 [Paenibacillus timonensis]|nr:hypothetical protein [Paenibacillus timonensis]MUG87651.1 hypothetical protein [Paenibacillus timonensis]